MNTKHFPLGLLAIALAGTGPLLAQERVSLQQNKIVVSDTDGDEVVTLGDVGFGSCPGILIREPTNNVSTFGFQACNPVLSLGTLDFPAALHLWGGTDIQIILSGETATGILGASGVPGALELRDTDELATVQLLGVDGSLRLGSSADDGDIIVYDADPHQQSFVVDGNTGNITNQLGGNGSVKAWAKISSDGSVVACWRCNADPAQTKKLATGQYSVSFSPLGANIESRPRMATIDSHGNTLVFGSATVANGGSGVVVATRSSSNTLEDRPFTVFIF